jgi:hypothetical protein
MTVPEKPKVYRAIIDELVAVCRNGQGQLGPQRVRRGIWNEYATKESIPDQHEINLLLARMLASDREILATMLAHEVEVGIFETLKVLEQFQVTPFTEGYEGSPFNDFVGRLADWKWPEK